MSKYLPERIFPLRMARSAKRLVGRVPLARMGRLEQSVAGAVGEASVDLHFGVSDAGEPRVEGAIEALLTFECRRCLEPVDMAIRADVRLALVRPEEEVELEGEYDSLPVDEGGVSLMDIVEDELILALPLMPVHADASCSVPHQTQAEADQGESPFAVLANWQVRS